MDIFVVGFPRSGNVWVSRLLGDALNSPVCARGSKLSIADEGHTRTGDYIIRQEHSLPDEVEGKTVLVIRDPRDVIVSAYHYWEMESILMAAECVLYGHWPTRQGGGWLNFYSKWKNYTHLVRYEDLVYNTAFELEYMLEVLGEESAFPINEVVDRQSFAVRKEYAKHNDLPWGKDVQDKALRKGVVGDWAEHFDKEALEYVAKRASAAKEYGYDIY